MAGKGSSFIMFRFFPLLYILLTYFCQRTSASSISGNCSTRVSYVYCFNSGLPSAWYNNNSVVMDGWKMRVFLLTKNANDVDFYCGFYCSGACNSYVFSVVATGGGGGNHTVVWSANKDRLVKENAMVQLTREGLVLQDSDGTQFFLAMKTILFGSQQPKRYLVHQVLHHRQSPSSTQPAENGLPGVTNLAPPPPGPRRGKGKKLVVVIAGSVAGVLVIVSVIIVSFVVRIRKTSKAEELVEDYIKQVPGMPVRFSYEYLRVATEDFRERLGGGGFGSVFKGDLPDGNKIAVKRLDGMGQGMREFLAEVETIGSLHHFNLDKAEEGRVLDILENSYDDMQNHWEEMVRMIKIGAWCLQDDPAHRPSMSTVVKVLEGVMEVNENINYKFAHAMPYASFVNHHVSAPPVESILSNPR
ncbi:hypothetical protein Patl1_02467 [Pistacia atlantica]|uniref:Uncharacterized protein n=1 Tax=Pistacia atlantica TaxID=434234 RepID=A0ACC1CAL1_9ROSI|nr:hypothetical protein Patl1_02467 [Pistacia atlantica]